MQRLLDGRNSLLQATTRQRDALVQERRWVEAEVNGFQRALVLVGASGAEDDTCYGGRRLQLRLEAQMSRASELTAEVGEIDKRIERIEAEIFACQEEMVGLLRRRVDDAEQKTRSVKQARLRRRAAMRVAMEVLEQNVMWSPTAVMGYRIWLLRKDGLYGAWTRWETPQLQATCSTDGDLPHTDGRCAEVAFGCGVYAAKSPATLMEELGGGLRGRYAVGLVGMEGKVIEHERGYRAERATVLALAVVTRGMVRMIEDATELEHLFRSPLAEQSREAIRYPVPADIPSLRATIANYLENQARRNEPWTSASHNA